MTPGLVIVAQAGRVCSAIRYCLDSIKTILFSHKLSILLDNILCSQSLSILLINILFSPRLPILETGSGLVTAYLQASLCDLQEYLIFGYPKYSKRFIVVSDVSIFDIQEHLNILNILLGSLMHEYHIFRNIPNISFASLMHEHWIFRNIRNIPFIPYLFSVSHA